MSKKALVINKQEFIDFLKSQNNGVAISDVDVGPDKYIHLKGKDILNFKPMLIEREQAENYETVIQVIPYITLVHLKDDGKNEPDPENKETRFFVYTRGPIGNEGRLHGKCSLGLGGHIEEEPTDEKTFDQVISSTAFKELFEEVGLVVQNFDNQITFSEYGSLFLDNSNPVGRVHLGLSVTLFVNPEDLKETEKDIITKGRWLTSQEIVDMFTAEENPIDLEDWSKMYIKQVLNISL
jgi:predicted NUDIX family phosphoesterase